MIDLFIDMTEQQEIHMHWIGTLVDRSTWQIAHLYIPESEFRGKSLPNLHSIEETYY